MVKTPGRIELSADIMRIRCPARVEPFCILKGADTRASSARPVPGASASLSAMGLSHSSPV